MLVAVMIWVQALAVMLLLMIFFFIIMAAHENNFEVRLGRPPADTAPKLRGVRNAVRQASHTPRSSGPKARQAGVRAHFAKGSATRTRPMSNTNRRVVVKVRYVANGGGRAVPLQAHVKYLARESAQNKHGGVGGDDDPERRREDPTRTVDYLTREEAAGAQRVSFYDRESSTVDPRAITSSWADDPRHFRMIVSAEDGSALGDLKPFVRELMAGLESRLGTGLEWLAVNHHDTDNPHSHILIRGRRPDGQDLFIPSRLISSGIREHAQDIVTRVLGPRLEADLARERVRDIGQVGITALDREIIGLSQDGRVLLPSQADLIARLERLEAWGLAERETGGWRLADRLPEQLKAMAVHDMVAREISVSRPGIEPGLLLQACDGVPVNGELVHVGPADEFGGTFLAVVETGSGEFRYAYFERPHDIAMLASLETGAIVAFEPNKPTIRPSDEAVARIAARNGGIYSQKAHLDLEPHVDRTLISSNIRRLENMRRVGLVQRFGAGEFIVGENHLKTALAFEVRLVHRAPFSIRVDSYWALHEQVTALGPTHLDRKLAGDAVGPGGEGRVVRDYEHALQQRRMFLIEQGWMRPEEIGPSRLTIARMADAELSGQARALSEEFGVRVLTHRQHRISGLYARRIDLAQGRMALILGDREAHLVPWRAALERFAGREVQGSMRGQTIAWSLSRGRGIGIS